MTLAVLRRGREISRPRKRGAPGRRFGRLAVGPATLILIALGIFPLLYALRLSFMSDNLLSVAPTRYVGIQNYTALIHDHLFTNGLVVTAFFAAAMVTLQLCAGLGLALALHRLSRYQQLLATVLLIPSILSPSVVGFQWLQLFNFSGGLINYFLRELHLPPQTWNASPRLAMPSLLIVDFWEWTPFMVLLLFAGLRSIPRPIFEAARVDGSSGWQILRYHTLPLLRRTIGIVVILRLVAEFKIFDIIYVLTAGGPGSKTESLAYYEYTQGFGYFNMGYTAAMCVISLIIVIILVKLILGFTERPLVRLATDTDAS
jgi:multiple sugar transport system permease protein